MRAVDTGDRCARKRRTDGDAQLGALAAQRLTGTVVTVAAHSIVAADGTELKAR